MIVNTPALDYYRATTSIFARYYDMIQEIIGYEEEDQKWTFQQYKGNRVGSIGHGQAMIDGTESYIIDIPGEEADEKMDQLVYSDMKATRIDIQVTIPKPDYWDSLEFMYQMKLGAWPGVPRGVMAWLNNGDDTVYVGSRESDRFIRVYVKESNYVRLEVEYKRALAAKAWAMVRNGGRSAINGMLQSEIGRMPQSAFLDDCMAVLEKYPAEKVRMEVERVKTSDIKKLKWLASLLPTIEKMMNDSDYGRTVTGWFIDLVERQVRK